MRQPQEVQTLCCLAKLPGEFAAHQSTSAIRPEDYIAQSAALGPPAPLDATEREASERAAS